MDWNEIKRLIGLIFFLERPCVRFDLARGSCTKGMRDVPSDRMRRKRECHHHKGWSQMIMDNCHRWTVASVLSPFTPLTTTGPPSSPTGRNSLRLTKFVVEFSAPL
jgi:hypothetical protein